MHVYKEPETRAKKQDKTTAVGLTWKGARLKSPTVSQASCPTSAEASALIQYNARYSTCGIARRRDVPIAPTEWLT